MIHVIPNYFVLQEWGKKHEASLKEEMTRTREEQDMLDRETAAAERRRTFEHMGDAREMKREVSDIWPVILSLKP